MFQITENKVFMDSVHGYISVPKCFVSHLIDTKMFQRLRNIDQTGMRILYPTAKHDRFGHSLGVYYLGCKAVDALLENFSKDMYWAIQSDHKAMLYWAKNKLLFSIACLLHDIGHVPFSHSLENEVMENSISDKDDHQFKKELAELICKRENDANEDITPDSITAAAHEQIGARYIIEHFSENIEAVYDDLIKEKYPSMEEDGFLYAENYDGHVILTKDTIDQDICFIVRMILGLKYTDYRPEKQIRNCFVELLNSSNFDVDKLDYILRDTKMSGISNVSVDVERLLGSISIVTKTVYRDQKNFSAFLENDTVYELETGIKKKAETDLEGMKEPEFKNGICLKGNMKGDIVLFPGTSVKICEGSKFKSLGEDNKKTKIIAHIPYTDFSAATEIIQDGNTIKLHSDIHPLDYRNHDPYQCVIKNAEIVRYNYSFTVLEASTVLGLDGECEIMILGKCKLRGVLTTLGSMTIKGDLVNLELLGNKLNNSIPNKSAYNEFSVGYKKQALNVIANVLEARDYLYLWIYAHHKVVYYANYLIPVLAKNVFGKKTSKAVRWQLNYQDILYLDDYYVWNQIKQTVLKKGTKAYDLYNELFDRKYKYSVYKSLAEFELLFSNCSDKLSVQSHLRENISQDQGCLKDSNGKAVAGYLQKKLVNRMKKVAKENGLDRIQYIRDIVFVEAMYKAKPINSHNTLIVMGDRVAAMEEIPLLKHKSSFNQRNTTYFFYLYYTTDECCVEEIPAITGQVKQLLQLYFS